MICVVLHCDVDGCALEQGYPWETLEANLADDEIGLDEVALRLGGMYGWRYTDGLVICPNHPKVPT